MILSIVERGLGAAGFACVPAGEGPFPAILVLHDAHPFFAGWAQRDAVLLAAHGLAALAVRDDLATAVAAIRGASFANGRLGVFSVGAGAVRVADLLRLTTPDALALHGPSPVDLELFATFSGPLFLSHGTEDERFPVETSRRLEAQARSLGREVEAHYYDGLDHGLNDDDAANRNTARWVGFFQRQLEKTTAIR